MRLPPLRFAALAAALLAISTALSAQGGGTGAGRGPAHGQGPAHADPGFKGLNLTEAQRAQMKAIHEKHPLGPKGGRGMRHGPGHGFGPHHDMKPHATPVKPS